MRPYYKDTKPQNRYETPVIFSVMILWLIFMILNYGKLPVANYIGISDYSPIPTAFFTYSLMATDIIGTLFAALTLYFIGKPLENTWGSKKFIIFLILTSLFGGIFFEAGAILFGGGLQDLATPWKLVSGIIVAWAFMYPYERINFWFVPIPSKIVALIAVLLEYFLNAPQASLDSRGMQIFAGLFALGSVLFAWLFVKYQYLFQKNSKQRNAAPKQNIFVRFFKELERRRRIAELKRKFRFSDEDEK